MRRSGAFDLVAIRDFGVLLHILQGGKVLFAGADLDHAGHIVNKDLAVADVSGVQSVSYTHLDVYKRQR